MYKVKQYSAPFPQIFLIEVMFLDALYLGCYNVSLRKDMLQKLGMCEFFNLSIHWRDPNSYIFCLVTIREIPLKRWSILFKFCLIAHED